MRTLLAPLLSLFLSGFCRSLGCDPCGEAFEHAASGRCQGRISRPWRCFEHEVCLRHGPQGCELGFALLANAGKRGDRFGIGRLLHVDNSAKSLLYLRIDFLKASSARLALRLPAIGVGGLADASHRVDDAPRPCQEAKRVELHEGALDGPECDAGAFCDCLMRGIASAVCSHEAEQGEADAVRVQCDLLSA